MRTRKSDKGITWHCDDEGTWFCRHRDGSVLYSIYPRHSHAYAIHEGYLAAEIDVAKTFKSAIAEVDTFYSAKDAT